MLFENENSVLKRIKFIFNTLNILKIHKRISLDNEKTASRIITSDDLRIFDFLLFNLACIYFLDDKTNANHAHRLALHKK